MSTSEATIHLRVLGQDLSASLKLPSDDMPPQAMLSVAHAITDAIARVASVASAAAGQPVSCRKGCAACCRQMVSLAPVEAVALAELVESMPADRQAHVRGKFSSAIQRVRDVGLIEAGSPDHDPILSSPGAGARDTLMDAWLDAYFDLWIDCPFLEENTCTIYADRPFICREYMITSPPENCSSVGRAPTLAVEMPLYLSEKLISYGVDADAEKRKIPLIFALAWSDAHRNQVHGPTNTADLLAELLRLVDAETSKPFSSRTPNPPGTSDEKYPAEPAA